jgi:thioredoxin reductase
MTPQRHYDVIIIGGSYSGLSAAMSLGRSLRSVLVIDSGLPCNRQTPHSHNFITHDGNTPREIALSARQQVALYNTVEFHEDVATSGRRTEHGFAIDTVKGLTFEAEKLVFATGVTDLMPAIPGFETCWGISVVHCPYCHGYEFKGAKTGIFANGDMAIHLAQLVGNLTRDLTIFTHGRSSFTDQQREKLAVHHIPIVDTELAAVEHNDGHLHHIQLKDGTRMPLVALYAKLPFVQHCEIPKQLGCELTDQGHVKVDFLQKASVPGVFACGDNASAMRAVANAVATGNMAGAALNRELAEERF